MSAGEFLEVPYRLSTSSEFNMIYFQVLSFALFALKEIGKAHGDIKAELAEKVNGFIRRKDVVFDRIVLNKNQKTYAAQLNALFAFAEELIVRDHADGTIRSAASRNCC